MECWRNHLIDLHLSSICEKGEKEEVASKKIELDSVHGMILLQYTLAIVYGML